ncbi:MAG: hypothetical protein JSR34_11770 [Proteobacteria bacterium]|nr:hypothetical protein [Pseudomonadota bacterium]
MGKQQIIQTVGTNDEDTAHLRLLLRVVREELEDEWIWGTEAKANLVVVDPIRLIGEAAMRRAIQRGVACVQLIGESDPKPAEGLYVRRPIGRAALASVLNLVSKGGPVVQVSEDWHDEFSELDLGGVDVAVLDSIQTSVVPGSAASVAAAVPAADPPPAPSVVAAAAPIAAPTEPAIAPTPTESAVRKQLDGMLGGEARKLVDPKARYPLIFYLERGVFSGPARIELPGVPALVLDPDEQVFFARGLLRMLEPYASEPLKFGDWKLLGDPEWEHVRRTASARPYVRLKWMDSYIHSDGFLAKHLDPTASFRLNNRLDLAGDYPRAFRVGTHMTVARKLHEIARMSAVGLDEVFNVINAYESIDYVECIIGERGRGRV